MRGNILGIQARERTDGDRLVAKQLGILLDLLQNHQAAHPGIALARLILRQVRARPLLFWLECDPPHTYITIGTLIYLTFHRAVYIFVTYIPYVS